MANLTIYDILRGSWRTNWYTNGAAGDGFTWANSVFNGVVHSNPSVYSLGSSTK
jgi:hypothetical protein